MGTVAKKYLGRHFVRVGSQVPHFRSRNPGRSLTHVIQVM